VTGVRQLTVAEADGAMRLDRWFKRHFPALAHGRLEKLLRTGQVRVDGRRARAGQHLEPGQTVRVPPLADAGEAPTPPARPVAEGEARELRRRILEHDGAFIAFDKPAGLAVQGGSRVARHLDGLLDALRLDGAERPRLVHRLDRDTSGVLLLARTAAAARALTASFHGREARKLYWAITVGVPPLRRGRIDLALAKGQGPGGEQVRPDPEGGARAVTWYEVVEAAGKRAAWVALWPETGRTHQLRVHLAAIGTPILGDRKYGGEGARLPGGDIGEGLHLHARRILAPHPVRGTIDAAAPLPPHFRATMRYLGFSPEAGNDDPATWPA
jgi:23S rRNA pseudouridine955/2504/2580 synthase